MHRAVTTRRSTTKTLSRETTKKLDAGKDRSVSKRNVMEEVLGKKLVQKGEERRQKQ